MDAREHLTRGPLGLVLVVGLFFGLAGVALHEGRFLHDEGLLTHLFALMTARDPAAALFLQKSRPPLSALYAPLSGSLDLFFWAHVTVSALGIVALWFAARALKHDVPIVAPCILALSPLYIGGAVAGLSNTDAVAGVCVFAWLYATDRRVAAGVLLGVLPWMRAELGVLAILFAVVALRRRAWKEVAALPVFGALYALAGIAYHHDPIWFLHYPPALSEPMPDNPYWAEHGGPAGLGDLVGTAIALSPVVPALALVRWPSQRPLERMGLWFCLAFTVALVVLPAWRIFNFDQSPRYLLPVVPFVALSVGRVAGGFMDESEEPGRLALPVLAALALITYLAARSGQHPTGLLAVTAVALALTAQRLGGHGLAAAVLAVPVLLGPWAFGDGGKIDTRSSAPHLAQMIEGVAEVVGDQHKVVYTNEPLLAVSLRRSGRLPNVTVLYIVQEDQRFELDRLANPSVGQREALWAAMEPNAYGRPIRPDALRPDTVPLGAVFALSKDARLALVMPAERWDGKLEVVRPGYDMMISVRVEGGEGP